MRSPQERNTRLENMTWRIWNLARKKKEVGSLSAYFPVCFVAFCVRFYGVGLLATILHKEWKL
jgi:hypothetical protein